MPRTTFSKTQAINSASEVAEMILRIDDIILGSSKPECLHKECKENGWRNGHDVMNMNIVCRNFLVSLLLLKKQIFNYFNLLQCKWLKQNYLLYWPSEQAKQLLLKKY